MAARVTVSGKRITYSPEPSKKSKSNKRNRSPRERSRERSKLDKSSDNARLPSGVESISEDDYFLKSAEFSRWLRVEKGKYFDELRAEKSRSYFRKFVKAWNRGKLSGELYTPIESTSIPSNQQTAYRWSFAANPSNINSVELKRVREEVGGDTYGAGPSAGSDRPRPGRPVQGPTLPLPSDLQLAREEAASVFNANNLMKRKREKNEDRERIEEMFGPKDPGREGMLEKKRAKRENDRSHRDSKEDAGLEVSEDALFGGGNSFKERLAQRDAARARFEAKKKLNQGAQGQERSERAEQMKERERKTMEMLKQMAKERFG